MSLWHPWVDKPGQRHNLDLWSNYSFPNVETVIEAIGGGQKYMFCNDILSSSEVDPEIIMHVQRKNPGDIFISRTGQMTALKLRHGKHCGFLIPGIVWGCPVSPGNALLESIQDIFDIFGYEAITPASLSEKILRSTLPPKMYISRPSAPLRDVLISNGKGARIDKAKQAYFDRAYEYDLNKAYLHFSNRVPSPFSVPVHFTYSDSWMDYDTGFIQVTMTAHNNGFIQPIQIWDDFGDSHEPKEGETFTAWLWKEEIFDCLQAGYSIEQVHRGYRWKEMSGFMRHWADILWEAYEKYKLPEIKKMMVGLPGRFLKRPETYTLIHRSEAKRGDIPVIANWQHGETPLTQWMIRAEYDLNSAQLTPIGSYIIMKCRQEIYKRQLIEQQNGNTLLGSYVDMFRVKHKTTQDILGSDRGRYKETVWNDVFVSGNRILGNINGKKELKAPGMSGVFRLQAERELTSWQ